MLTRSTTASLLVAVVLATVVTWFVHQNVFPEGSAPRERFLFLGEIAPYETLEIERDGTTLSCQRREGTWWITSPVSARADDEQIQRLLDTLAVAPIQDVISGSEQRARDVSQRDYGLSEPQARVFLDGPLVPPVEFRIGAPAVHGQSLYVGITGSPSVWVTDLALLEAVPAGLGDIRDRNLLPHPPARLKRFELRSPGNPLIAMEQETDGLWWIKQPELRRADQETVATLLNYVGGAHLLSFVHTPDGTTGRPRHSTDIGIPYGCTPEEAAGIARFWFSGTRSEFEFHELLLGKPAPDSPDEVYLLSTEEGFVATVSSTLVPALRVKPDDLRDRRVWPFPASQIRRMSLQAETGSAAIQRNPGNGQWTLVEPFQAPANTQAARRWLESLTELTDLHMVNTNAPAQFDFLIELALEQSSVIRTALVSRITSRNDSGPVERLDWFFPASQTARRTEITTLPPDFGTPPFFASLRDPVLLRVDQPTLYGISFQKGTNTVLHTTLHGTNGWALQESEAEPVLSVLLQNLAESLHELQALRVEALVPVSLDTFGLRDAFGSLTFRFRDPSVPQRILLLGNVAPEGGRFAMLKGQDSVFLLSREDTEVLTAPLLLKP